MVLTTTPAQPVGDKRDEYIGTVFLEPISTAL